MSEVKNAIINAQHRLVDGLIAWEKSLAKLYSRYAELFPDDAGFWKQMSKEEVLHAKALRPMHDVIDQGFLLENIGEFHEDRISDEVEEVKQAIARAESGKTTQFEAITTARNFESSVIDSQFYSVVKCESPVFQRVAGILLSQTGQHAKQIQQRWELLKLGQ